MYIIKRYANGRFYDTEMKNYITQSRISELLSSGRKLKIIETKTNRDITSQIVSKIQSRRDQKKARPGPDHLLVQLFGRKGDILLDYGRKYASVGQDLLAMSREEVDKLLNRLQKDKKISESEAKNLKEEIQRYRGNIRKWITKNIDSLFNDLFTRMNLASRDQVVELTQKIKELESRIEKGGSAGPGQGKPKPKS